jgi:hypothetical protein
MDLLDVVLSLASEECNVANSQTSSRQAIEMRIITTSRAQARYVIPKVIANLSKELDIHSPHNFIFEYSKAFVSGRWHDLGVYS